MKTILTLTEKEAEQMANIMAYYLRTSPSTALEGQRWLATWVRARCS